MDFSISRLFLLINKDIILYRNKVLLAVATIFIITFLSVVLGHNLISLRAGGGIQGLFMLYMLLLLVGGGFLTSTNLGDLKTVSNRISYIGLPASTLEKVVIKIIYTLPLYAGVLMIIYWAFYNGYLAMYGKVMPAEALDTSQKTSKILFLYMIQYYVLGHSIAFFFSFLYNNYASIKGAIISVLIFLTFCTIRSFFIIDRGFGFIENLGQSTWEVMVQISLYPNLVMLVSPLFWVLSYLVFKKKSV